MNSSITIERKRVDCNSLPKGWQREEVLRKSGISAGKVDVFYYSPTGKRIESKPQLARYLGDAIDIGAFDFQSGKMVQHLPLPSISLYRCSSGGSGAGSNAPLGSSAGSSYASSSAGFSNTGASSLSLSSSSLNTTNANMLSITAAAPNALKRKYKAQTHSSQSQSQAQIMQLNVTTTSASGGGPSTSGSTTSSANTRQHLEYSRAPRTDVSLVPPIRQTASIFKQPVTVIRNHENTKVHHDTKQTGGQEKPKQLFWEKRLERMRACHASGEEFEDIVLPKTIRPIGPNVNEQTVLQSLATALHVLNVPVLGQTASKTDLNKNANAFTNPEQPLMLGVMVSDDDIRRQEDRVNAARKKLQDALKA